MRSKLFAVGLSLVLAAAGLPVFPAARAEASPAGRSCCMKNGQGPCCCGIAGGCGMCRGEGMATLASDDRPGLLKLVRCPGPSEKRAEAAGGSRDIVFAPVMVAFLQPPVGFVIPSLKRPSENPSSVPDLPPPRRSSVFSS